MGKNLDDYGLDPRKFDNDMLDESPEPSDDETFASIYAGGLSIAAHRPDYPAWCEWLGKTHPDDARVQKGKGYAGLMKDGKQRADEEAGEEPDAGRNG